MLKSLCCVVLMVATLSMLACRTRGYHQTPASSAASKASRTSSDAGFLDSEEADRKTLTAWARDLNVVFWGDVLHGSAGSVEALERALHSLHAAGFRTLVLEVSEAAQPELDRLLSDAVVRNEDFSWETNASRLPVWQSIVARLRAWGGWKLEAGDFKQRFGVTNEVKKLLKEERHRIAYCGRSLDTLQKSELDLVLEDNNFTPVARALGDLVSARNGRTFWAGLNKAVVFYGMGHGNLNYLPQATVDGKSIGYMARYLADIYPNSFRTVFPLPRGTSEEKFYKEVYDAFRGDDRKGLIPSTEVLPLVERAIMEVLTRGFYPLNKECSDAMSALVSPVSKAFHAFWME